MTTDPRYLRIYLNDHLAGAAAGLALAKRCRGSNTQPPLGPFLDGLIAELEVDKRLLESIMGMLGFRRSVVKQAGAVVGERLGRLKFNGALLHYSPLSRLVELEGLRLGAVAKRSMWRVLLETEGLDTARVAVDDALVRADGQIEALEQARLEAAIAMFGEDPVPLPVE